MISPIWLISSAQQTMDLFSASHFSMTLLNRQKVVNELFLVKKKIHLSHCHIKITLSIFTMEETKSHSPMNINSALNDGFSVFVRGFCHFNCRKSVQLSGIRTLRSLLLVFL